MKTKNILLLLSLMTFCFGEGATYLIITHDNFYNAIQPLAKWKQKKGIPTKVVKLSEIGATPTNITLIKNYIINAYNSWNPRPEYILLVGNGNYIRAENDEFDDYYANVAGDYRMELSVGRFPVGTASQCSVMVAKTLAYERTPYLADTTWYLKATTIVREDGTTHPDTVYWNDARHAHTIWMNAGFALIDSQSRLRGGNSTTVMNAINNGRAYVLYRGTATANWYNPFQSVNPTNLTNGFKLPIIISSTCATMSFYYTDYLGNRFMTAGTVQNPKGAVAFVGTTIATSGNGLARLRGTVSQMLFEAVFTRRIYRLGDAFMWAKNQLAAFSPPYYTTDRYREWNLFGDPELNLWTTKPQSLTVMHDTVIQTIPQYFTITVRNRLNNQPVANALACIMFDTLIYQYGYTNSSGQISFFISPSQVGTMSVTVSAHNFIPYEKNVSVQYGFLTHDVGILSIVEPIGTINSQNLIIPKVKVKNYGSSLDTFMVVMRIGNVYSETINNIILSPNDTITVSFPTWLSQAGNYPVIAYTDLTNDQFRANDTAIVNIIVNISNDVGISSILSPDPNHNLDSIMRPKARVKNYGVVAQNNIPVTCSIISSTGFVLYTNTQTINSLVPNESLIVTFSSWLPTTTQLCTVKFKTHLVNDENNLNDQKIRITNIISAIEEQIQSPKQNLLFLQAIQPNPITNNVTIKFALDIASPVTLTIYDTYGRIIKTLINEKLLAGEYLIHWDSRNEKNHLISAGIYFCTLQTLQYSETKKIIVNR
ncbi:MAG: C25 family cysteine peptidase [candidate division WOR-3 bacterium]